MIFQAKNSFILQWTLTDSQGNPINNAVVTASLYSGRSITSPEVYPGVIVPPVSNITLAYVAQSAGVYQALLPDTLDPPPDITGFVLVIDASIQSVAVYHFEEPSTVQAASATTSKNDLCSLLTVKSWLSIPTTNTSQDQIIQLLISAFSTWVLHRTGRDSFNTINTYTETLDGDGATRLFLRNSPIETVISVLVGNWTLPQSTSLISNGWYIEDSKKSIALRICGNSYPASVPSGIYPYQFSRGQGNIQVTYTAGYTAVPFDLEEAVMKAVAINYVRKDWIDMASKALSSGVGVSGTTSYRSWALPPEISMVLDRYTRRAIV